MSYSISQISKYLYVILVISDIFGTSCKSNDECNIAMPGNAKELDRALFICKNTVCTCSDGYYFNTKLDYCVQGET